MKRKTLALTIVSSCALIFAACNNQPAVKKYNIIFQNDDGEVLQESKVKKGELPVYEGADPEKASTAQYSYTWSGWDPEIAPASQDQTYTATFSRTVRSYTIRFVDEDGTTVLDSQVLEYGATPVYAGQTPEKASTAQYSYTFGGWNPAISSVVGDATYTATFTPVLRSYLITFLNGDNSVLEEKQVSYGETPATALTPTKASTVDKVFTFTGWSPALAPVDSNATYTPQFSEATRKYMITFLNGDGSTLEQKEVEYGTVPTTELTPTKASTAQYEYSFTGWDPTPVEVSGDATYTPVFGQAVREYTIKFLNGDDSVLEQHDVAYGQLPACSATPTKAQDDLYTYSFREWDNDVVAVTGEATYAPLFDTTVRALDVNEEYDFTSFKFGASEFDVTGENPDEITSWAMELEAHLLKYKTYNNGKLFECRLPRIIFTEHPDVSAAVRMTNYHGRLLFGLEKNDITHGDGVESDRDITGRIMFSYDGEKLYESFSFGTITINNVIEDQDIINGLKPASIYVKSLFDRWLQVYDFDFGTETFVAPEIDLTASYGGAYIVNTSADPESDVTWLMGRTRTVNSVNYTSTAEQLMFAGYDMKEFRFGLPKVNFVLFKCLSMDLFAPGWNSNAKLGLKADDINYSYGSNDTNPRGNLVFAYSDGHLFADLYIGDTHVHEEITDNDIIIGNANPVFYMKAYYDRQIIASNIKINPQKEIRLNHDWSLDKMDASLFNGESDVTWGLNTFTTETVLGYRVWDMDTFKLGMPKINYSMYSKVVFTFESTQWHKNVLFGVEEDDVTHFTTLGDDGSGDIASLTGSLIIYNNSDSLAVNLILGDTVVTTELVDLTVLSGTNSLNIYVKAYNNRNLLLNSVDLYY